MDMHIGSCMGKLVGPAGGGGAGGVGGGGGISTQFRVLPNSVHSDCYSVDAEKVPVGGQRAALHLRLSSPTTPHRPFNPEPLKIGDEYLSPGTNSPLADMTTGFLLRDPPALVRVPSLTHSPPVSSQSGKFPDVRFALDDSEGATKAPETESLMVTN